VSRERLRRSADFRRCYREGRRRGGGLATLHFLPNQVGHPRLGLTVSRRVGDAVVRNRLKRWAREFYRRSAPRERLAGVDLVVEFKPAARTADRGAVEAELERAVAGWLGRGGGR
jgi:ribonuclease P protein component